MNLLKFPAQVYLLARKVRKRVLRALFKPLFKQCGRDVHFDPDDFFSYDRISIGQDVFIGSGACFATITEITIGDHVMFGPQVMIRGGNHNTELNGVPMSRHTTKRPEDDQPVHIETDAWIGSCAILLKGVTIGRGAVVGAGSIVTKSVPPYAIVVGVPARVIGYRGSRDQIAEHEQRLYPLEQRLDLNQHPLSRPDSQAGRMSPAP